MARSQHMLNYYKSYKEYLDLDNKDDHLSQPFKIWRHLLFYCYLIFWGYTFWMEPLSIS